MVKHEGVANTQNEVKEDAVANAEASKDVAQNASESAPVAELSLEERMAKVENETAENKQEIAKLAASVERTKAQVNAARNEVRIKMGLKPEEIEDDPQSVLSDKDKIKKLQDEQRALEKQKEELVSQQEKEQLIRVEKERILQEKLNGLFKEFEGLGQSNLESILSSGKTLAGLNLESQSMGSLEPQVAQSLAKAFKEGSKLLPKILEALPDLLKEFDEQLTEEATENVEAKLESEKKKMVEGNDAQKQKVLEAETPPVETEAEAVPGESKVVENPQ